MTFALTRRSVVVGLAAACAGCDDMGTRALSFTMSSRADPKVSGSFVWADTFAKAFTKASGRKIDFYPSSALGGESERFDMVELGLVELDETASDELRALAPLFMAVQLPFLFDDDAHFERFVSNGPFLERVNAQTVPAGVRVLDVALLGGMGGVHTARRAVRTLKDLQSLRLRAKERTDLALINAWGVHGAQVAWEEVPQALETGIVDGYLNSPIVSLIFGQTKLVPNFCNLRLTPASRVIIASEKWLARLTAAEAAAVRSAAVDARTVNRAWAARIRVDELRMLKEAGVTITEMEPDDAAELRRRSRSIYTQIMKEPALSEAIELAAHAR
jgi:TRAP-type transport system periplasmic protein